MARIQILELPCIDRPDGTTETPFVLIIDQLNDASTLAANLGGKDIATQLGARGILAFDETIELPGNWAHIDTPGSTTVGTVRVKVEPDLTGFEEAVVEAAAVTQRRIDAALS